jgi:hypothetical protein
MDFSKMATGAAVDVSQLKFYSIGIVAVNKHMSRDTIEVLPTEHFPYHDGEITDSWEEYEGKGKDYNGKEWNHKVDTTTTVLAKWLPLSISNRITAPDVRRGEHVLLFRFGDVDEFYWTTLFIDKKLRRLETVTYSFSNNREENKEDDYDSTYSIEVSTHGKYIHVHTAKNDNEPFAYDIQLNTKDGCLTITDDLDPPNKIVMNSKEKQIYLQNNDNSYIDINKKKIKIRAIDKVEIETEHFEVNASKDVNIKTEVYKLDASKSIDNKTTDLTNKASASIKQETKTATMTATDSITTNTKDNKTIASGKIENASSNFEVRANQDVDIQTPKIDMKASSSANIESPKIELKASNEAIFTAPKMSLTATGTLGLKGTTLTVESNLTDIKASNFKLDSATSDIRSSNFTITGSSGNVKIINGVIDASSKILVGGLTGTEITTSKVTANYIKAKNGYDNLPAAIQQK